MEDDCESSPGGATRLSATEIDRLRESWFDVETGDIDLAERFYERLFEAAPEVRSLFRGDLPSQNRKFMSTLALVVDAIDEPASIANAVIALGQRHIDYGVEPHHYKLVGEALLATLAEAHGEQFDDVTRQAWRKAYALVANAMQAAAEEDALL